MYPREQSRSECQRFHFILMIPPLYVPIVYLILNQSMGLCHLQIRLRAPQPLTVCFSVRWTFCHSSFCCIPGSSDPIW